MNALLPSTATPWPVFPVATARILVAHGDPRLRHRLVSKLRWYGYTVDGFTNGLDVLEFVADSLLDPGDPCRPGLIIADIRLPGWTGADPPRESRGRLGPTRARARSATAHWLEAAYNRQPRHSAIDMLSPVHYEERYWDRRAAP